jgi:hypothetical protein
MSIREHHRNAMEHVDEALQAQRRGMHGEAHKLFSEALKEELKAIQLCRSENAPEPTFSILHRSAASLAVDCGEIRVAEKLIAAALAADPPLEIAEELRDLLETVHLARHLKVRGVTLEADEMQLSIAGRAVGFGLASSNAFVERVEHTSKMIYRIVERKMKRPFREWGAARKDVREGYELFISVPRASSFAVSLKLGRPTLQVVDPELTGITEIIDELFTCVSLLNEGKEEELRIRIGDDAYYNNFVGLTRLLAPDGDEVSVVGLTSSRYGEEKRVALTRKAADIRATSVPDSTRSSQPVTVKGKLLFADATPNSGKIKIIDRDGKGHSIKVPPGMMADIVRPLWECDVIVTALRIGRELTLDGVRKVEPSDAPTDDEFFYVNIGEGEYRSWEDFRKYGFVSAGHGENYTKQLQRLSVGDKFFAYLKGFGYVGYGEVISQAIPINDFVVSSFGKYLDKLPLENSNLLHDFENPELSEWAVSVLWIRTFSKEGAQTFGGIFANENIACRLRNRETIKFLREAFDVPN